jgi:3-phosphoshikimate 1-carboxyvinyltransferase
MCSSRWGARIELLNGREVAGEPVGDLRVTHGSLKAFTIDAALTSPGG